MSDLEKLAKLAVDCGFKIHRDLGPGLLESVYETLLAAKLAVRGFSLSGRSRSILNMTEFA
jgi:iron complex transport system substrate-binding protein